MLLIYTLRHATSLQLCVSPHCIHLSVRIDGGVTTIQGSMVLCATFNRVSVVLLPPFTYKYFCTCRKSRYFIFFFYCSATSANTTTSPTTTTNYYYYYTTTATL